MSGGHVVKAVGADIGTHLVGPLPVQAAQHQMPQRTAWLLGVCRLPQPHALHQRGQGVGQVVGIGFTQQYAVVEQRVVSLMRFVLSQPCPEGVSALGRKFGRGQAVVGAKDSSVDDYVGD